MPTSLTLRRVAPRALFSFLVFLALATSVFGVRRAVDADAPTPETPVVLRWANEGISDLLTLDPARGPDFNAIQAAQLIYSGLVRFGPGFSILPDAAERWAISLDGRTYTFHLRPGIRFADGTPLRAQDVAYSLARVLSPRYGSTSGWYLLGDIEGAADATAGRTDGVRGISVLDARTLRIRLTHASGSFLAKLATQAGYIVPPRQVQADPAGWDRHAFGTGPFRVARWVHGQALYLTPNPYYYGGAPRIKAIIMPFIPEPLIAYKRYRDGAVDIMGTVHFPTEALYNVQDQPDFHRSPRLETVYLTLNTRTAPFADGRVRLAFAHALDLRAVAQGVYAGFAHPATGMLPAGIPGFNPTLQGNGYDPQLARRLLAEAGYPGGRGMPAVTYLVDQDAQSLVLASALAAQWERVLGIRVRLVQRDHSAYNLQLRRDDFQMAVIDWTRDYPDPQNFLSQLLHSGYVNNNGGWHDARFDRLVDEADAMPAGDPGRMALYRRAEAVAIGQAAVIPLVNPSTGILLRPHIHGLQVTGGTVLATNWARVTVVASNGLGLKRLV